ncbi:RidA family protein [uncultured Tessaracoccus sp.]|uniref:RidA family protein n=1 Tax=uncultured Tessaracoccus sp. TaxID=905023 RepID=UPI0025EE2CE0|nr:RidA family protein [uncultured Tessaracoccus sp.]
MDVIRTADAPAAVGPYSQAVRSGDLVFASGQIPLTPDGVQVAGDVQAQARQCLANVTAVLAAAGLTLADVVKTTVFLTDIDDFAAVNEVYGEHFREPWPARSAIAVAALPKGANVEVEVIARA